MGTAYQYECNICGHKVYTSGPWEFYRNEIGEIKGYGHPTAVSEEAEKRGIWGFTALIYCPFCDAQRNTILVEFLQPVFERGIQEPKPHPEDNVTMAEWVMKDSLQREKSKSPAWEALYKYLEEHPIQCPVCQRKSFLEITEAVICPRCRKGKFIGGMRRIA